MDRPESHPTRPRELERRPEGREMREVPEGRALEARFREQSEQRRLLGLPRVEGFERSGVMNNDEVRDYLKTGFPERHANNITMESVRYHDQHVPTSDGVELAHWQKKEVVPGIGVHNREVVINRQRPEGNTDGEAMKDAIAHEIGHQTHQVYLDTGHRQEWESLSGERRAEHCVSDYARTDHNEDFAESYRAFLRDPESLQRASQEKYDFMREQVFASAGRKLARSG